MYKTIITVLAAIVLSGCGTILPAGYGVFAPAGSDEQIAAQDELSRLNGAVGAFAGGFGRSYAQPRPQLQRPSLPVYTTCTSNRFTGMNCISQ